MSAYFFDSSALYKRYIYEPGSNWVKAICEARGARSSIYIAQIARIEMVAAFYRAARLAHQHEALIDSAAAEFERHIARSAPKRKEDQRVYQVLPITESLVELAALLCRKHRDLQPHPLRTLDAIQLASAIVSRQLVRQKALANGDALLFVSADTRLLAIAAAEGFPVRNPMLLL